MREPREDDVIGGPPSEQEAEAEEGDEGSFRHEPGRLFALVDGIFAISMTLLVIDIRIPDGTAETAAGYAANEHELYKKMAIFVGSFFIASRFWVVNHRQMRRLHHIDSGVIERTIAFLCGICALPVAASVIFRFGSVPAAVTFASLVLGATNLLSARLWWYFSSPRRDLADVSAHERRQGLLRAVGNGVIYVAAIPVAYLLPEGSKGFSLLLWLLLRVIDPVSDQVERRWLRRFVKA